MTKILFGNQNPSNHKGKEIKPENFTPGLKVIIEENENFFIGTLVPPIESENWFISKEGKELVELNDHMKVWEWIENDKKTESDPLLTKQQSQPLKDNIDKGNAQFPDWDIVPPNQIINPRIRNK